MNAAFVDEAARVLGPARVLIGLWFLLAVAQRLANGRSPAVWGRGSAWAWPWLRRVFGAQALLAAGLIASTFAPDGGLVPLVVCLAMLLASQSVLLFVTGTFWADGAEKIGMIAMAGTLLIAAGVLARDPALALAGALLAGGQVALCYAVAGISKMPVARWRDGRELVGVMGSRTFGYPGLAHLLARHRGIAMLASWAVILAEAAFPLALFAPEGWLAAALAVLFAFHLGTAVFMGLNTFPWAFAAAYPATWLLGHAIRGAIG